MINLLLYESRICVMNSQDVLECFTIFIKDSVISLLITGANFTLYYASKKLLQSSQDNLNQIESAPLFRDFSQIKSGKSEFPYAVVEGKVCPNSETISSQFDERTKGVVQKLKVWQLKKVWNVVIQTWEKSRDLFGSYERHVPMNIVDRKNNKIFIDNFSECSQHKLLEEISSISEPNDDHFVKKILDNILQREVVVGYKRVEKMLRVGQTVIFCGKVAKHLEGSKYVLRLSKPESPLSFECTALSYESLLNMKRFDVRMLKVITVVLGAGATLMAVYCALKFANVLIDKMQEQRREVLRMGDFILEPETLEIAEPPEDSRTLIAPNTQGRLVCSICYERPICLMVKNCNHACLCLTCAPKVDRKCPICRAAIQKFEKIYLP